MAAPKTVVNCKVAMIRCDEKRVNVEYIPTGAGNPDWLELHSEHPYFSTMFTLLMAAGANKLVVDIGYDVSTYITYVSFGFPK